MSKRLLFLIVPTAAAFVLLLGVIAVDFVRVRTGAMPGEAPGLAAYLSTAGGRLEATREASQKVAAIGVTPPAPEEAKQAQAAPEKKAQPADTETQTVSVEVAQAGAGSSWFGFASRKEARQEAVTFSCSTDEIGVKRCVSDARK